MVPVRFLLMTIALKTAESTSGIEPTIDLMEKSLGLAKKFPWLVNTLFNKVLAENEKYVFCFYLKPNEHFGQPNTLNSIKRC